MTTSPPVSIKLIKSGKVRDIYEINESSDLLAMTATDRVSSFDRYLTKIPHKGEIINSLSAWWLNQTKNICPNHLIYSYQDTSIVKKCQVIPIEVVVRAYITGSTNTSMWTHYNRGVRTFCGINFPDGLKKNQKLPNGPVITPTTKSEEHDQPISFSEIIDQGICTSEEWDYISQKALQLFNYAQQVANERDFILVDTKLEFGRLLNTDQIILIDELFTCDSSRYWRKSTYKERFDTNQEPENLDKDVIRKYVKEKYPNIYQLPDNYPIDIPETKVQELAKTYLDFYHELTSLQLNLSQLNTEQIVINYLRTSSF